jgi:hypothetical protein
VPAARQRARALDEEARGEEPPRAPQVAVGGRDGVPGLYKGRTPVRSRFHATPLFFLPEIPAGNARKLAEWRHHPRLVQPRRLIEVPARPDDREVPHQSVVDEGGAVIRGFTPL